MRILPALIAFLCMISSLVHADEWAVLGNETEPGEPWVTEPANTTLAQQHVFRSEAVGEPVSYHVLLPPGYGDDPEQAFPVLYWLHGAGPGTIGIPWLANYYNNHMTAGRIPPMIVVFPNGLPDGMWCDSKDGSTPVESMLIGDLLPHIDDQFRTLASREGRVLEGFSMGGYGAGRLGLKHPDLFCAFSMIGSGPLQLDLLVDDPNLLPLPYRRRIFQKVYGGDMAYFEAQSPWRIAEAQAGSLPEELTIRILIGADDYTLAGNQAFHQHLLELEIPHEYVELPDVAHSARDVFLALGPGNWSFYNSVLSGPGGEP